MNKVIIVQISSFYIPTQSAYLGESSDSVLIGKEWRVIANLEVKVNRFVREGWELIAEAELVGAIFGCCEGKAVVLLLHLLVESSSIWVLQTTVHIVVATSDNLQKHKEHQYINVVTQHRHQITLALWLRKVGEKQHLQASTTDPRKSGQHPTLSKQVEKKRL